MTLLTPAPLAGRCPRCRGRLVTHQDWAGRYSTCFLCGYVHEWGRPTEVAPPVDGPSGRPRRRRQPVHQQVRL